MEDRDKTMAISDWSDFTVRIYQELIRIDFKNDPRSDEQGKKVIAMLEKAGFELEARQTSWTRSRTDFWVEQCRKLAQKFGANVVDTPNITDPIAQMQEQMAAMQAELAKLREEVEYLKKFEPSDG